jgi:hypothetical protein
MVYSLALPTIHFVYSVQMLFVNYLCFIRAARVHKFVGDTTGILHVGPQQTVIGQFADDGEFEINTHVYEDGILHLPKSFLCREIQITNRWVEHFFLNSAVLVQQKLFQLYTANLSWYSIFICKWNEKKTLTLILSSN